MTTVKGTLNVDEAVTLDSTLDVTGNISIGGSNNELRFYEGANYVGFEAPALSADQIWVLPNANGSNGQVLTTDASGNLSWSTVSGGISFDGSTANGICTFKDSDEATVESNLTFDVSSNISTLQIASDQDTGDLFKIATTTHGATTITTVDDDAAAANLTFTIDGAINLNSVTTTAITSGTTMTLSSGETLAIDTVGTDAINFGIEAAAKTITIGNAASTKVDVNALIIELDSAGTIITNSVTTTEITSGTTTAITSGTTMTLSSGETLAIDTVGTDAINFGIEAAAKTITIGNAASTKVDVNALIIELDSAGTIITNSVTTTEITSGGNMTLSSGGILAIDTVGTDAINFGTQAAAKTITIGNATGATAVNITTGTGGLDIVGDTTTFSSANSNDPLVIIKNTTDDVNGARLQFVKDKGSAGADGDDIGSIEFVGDDAAQAQTTFAKILAEVSEADNTDEAGKLSFFVAASDGTTTTPTAGLIIEGEHATDGEVDVTIGAGTSSTTTIAGKLNANGNIYSSNTSLKGNGLYVDPTYYRNIIGGEIITTILIDIDGLDVHTDQSGSFDKRFTLGNQHDGSNTNNSYLLEIDSAVMGSIFEFELICIEEPKRLNDGAPIRINIGLGVSSSGAPTSGSEVADSNTIIDNTNWTSNMGKRSYTIGSSGNESRISVDDKYLILLNQNIQTSDNDEITQGKFMIKMRGVTI